MPIYTGNSFETLGNASTENLYYLDHQDLATTGGTPLAIITEDDFIITTEDGPWITTEGS